MQPSILLSTRNSILHNGQSIATRMTKSSRWNRFPWVYGPWVYITKMSICKKVEFSPENTGPTAKRLFDRYRWTLLEKLLDSFFYNKHALGGCKFCYLDELIDFIWSYKASETTKLSKNRSNWVTSICHNHSSNCHQWVLWSSKP